jgi:hypothetical protein
MAQLTNAWLQRALHAVVGGMSLLVTLTTHFVTQFNHTALVGFDLGEMECNVFVESFEERDSITNEDRQDRIRHLIG